MSKIDFQSVLELSHLNITKDRESAFSAQLGKILDYMAVLDNVTDKAEEAYQWPIQQSVLTRQDEPESFSSPLVAENAPDFKSDGFSVPRIV